MKRSTTIVALSSFFRLAYSHGFVTSPQARMPGAAMEAACGTQVYDNQEADNYGNIQSELQIASSQSDYNAAACDIWLCKGYKLADNTANVFSYTAGQVIDMVVDIRAPHTGIANVSIVDTTTNTVIGDVLKYWSVYASVATGVTANETNFSVTMPDNLGDQCSTAGACVIQWYWYAESIDQTYESCIDFTVGGSGSSSGSSTSSISVASSAVVSTPTPTVVASSASAPARAVQPSTFVTSVISTARAVASSEVATVVPSSVTSVSSPSSSSTSASSSSSSADSAETILEQYVYMVEEILNYKSGNRARDLRRAARA